MSLRIIPEQQETGVEVHQIHHHTPIYDTYDRTSHHSCNMYCSGSGDQSGLVRQQ